MSPAEAPRFLKPSDQVHQFGIVPKLRVYDLDVFCVSVHEQGSQICEASLDVLAQLSRRCALVCTDLAADVVSHNKYGSI